MRIGSTPGRAVVPVQGPTPSLLPPNGEEPQVPRHRADKERDATIAALQAWRHNLLCPRCGSFGPVGFGAQLVCPRCGCVWQADAPEALR